MRKGNEGFTLVELMAGIVCVTLVIGAAMSMMLMGQRTNRALNDAAGEQQTSRIITTMVEKLASEGDIYSVDYGSESESGNWELLNAEGSTILAYSAADNAIFTKENAVLVNEVTSSSLKIAKASAEKNGYLLNFSITIADKNTYDTSVFCRLSTNELQHSISGEGTTVEVFDEGRKEYITITDNYIDADDQNAQGRFELLQVLCNQFGSTGQIIYRPQQPAGTPDYYSQWYIGNTAFGDNGWNANTPWCGCFVSWGVDQLDSALLNNNVPKFANVDSGRAYFEGAGGQKWQNAYIGIDAETNKAVYYKPTPGDFIFFSWDGDSATLEHVGAVFAVNGEYVYTIEGNSGGKVALHRYNATDPRIIGYGVLDWKTD